jgi:cell division control protein 6
MPKLISHREKEQKQIAACIAPLTQERNGRNCVVTGRPGIGKTVACKHILDELEDKYDDIFPVYVNCWKHTTSFKIIMEVCNQLGYKLVHNKKTDELLDAAAKILNNRKSAVFLFDEIDKAEDYDFLYMLLEGIYRKSIILVTNHKEWILGLDERIKSRLTPDVIEFRQYDAKEIMDILKQRADVAFYPNVLDKDLLEVISVKTFEIGDVRQGLYLLREAANAAEDESSKKILKKHVEKAIEKLSNFMTKKTSDLEEETRDILEIIKNNSGKRIGELFEVFKKDHSCTYKTFQRKIQKLAANKFISVKKTSGGKEGNTTIVDYASSKKLSDF